MGGMEFTHLSHCLYHCEYHLVLTTKFRKKLFPFLKQVYWGTEAVWSEGYFASTVGANESIIKRYIENQGKEETGQATLELN